MTGWWAAAFVVQWMLVVVLAVVVVALARQVGTLHLRLGPRGALEVDDEGPPLGEAPPPLPATTTAAGACSSAVPGPARLVLFSRRRARSARRWRRRSAPAASAAGLTPQVVHDADAERGWDVPGTPFAVVLDRRASCARRAP